MPTAIELARELERKRAELSEIFKKSETGEVNSEGRPTFNLNADQLLEVNQRNAELKKLNEEWEQARLQEMATANAASMADLKTAADRGFGNGTAWDGYRGGGSTKPQVKRLSDYVIDSLEYKSRSSNRNKFGFDIPGVDVKTLIETSAGFAPANNRTSRVVYSAQRRPVVADLIPTDTTELSVIKWMSETAFSTDSATTVAEGGLKPEGILKFTEVEANVRKIAIWVPITEEQLDDVPQMRNIVDNRLTLMLQFEEEAQLISGDGNSPNLRGFLNATGLQTQAKSTDSVPDAIYKAFTLVRHTGYAEPTGVIMHPNDWQAVRLLTTTDGLYIFGNPSEEIDPRIWGKPVVVTKAMTENTALTGDFVMYSHISRKSGVRIDVSDSHDTYFIYNKLAIRAEMRESLEIFRGAAFCQVTGV